MRKVVFLLDENIPNPVAEALRRSEPLIEFHHSGHEDGTPVCGTRGPEVLVFAEDNGLALVTFDKRTMLKHVLDHLANGRHTWGVFVFPTGNEMSAGVVSQELNIVWGASDAEEWIDRFENLPY
jgi:hypothetical protein